MKANVPKMLLLNRSLTRSSRPAAPFESHYGGGRRSGPGANRCLDPSYLLPDRPVNWAPVRTALSDGALFERSRSRKGNRVLTSAFIILLIAGAGAFFGLGLDRVQNVRKAYQVSLQLRQSDWELRKVQRAYHALQAYVATQATRELQQSEVMKVSLPAPAVKRSNRS